MAEKQTNKQRLKEITDSIEANIQELFQSERYMNYLRTMSRFHKYSFNNTMLIHMQKPDATLVTGYSKWEQKFNRHVKRGEKGIRIIAPTPFKKKIEQEKLDPDTKLPLRDKDGNIIMEEKEVKIPMFKPVVVFDVSQTEGEPLPTLSSDLRGDVKHYEIFMEALRRSSPVPMELKAISGDMDGFFNLDDQSITIREGMSEVQTICAAVHEITHAKLHNIKDGLKLDDKEEYDEIELFDKPALFSNGRVDRDKLPEGLYAYDLRGGDDDPGAPVTVENRVVVNHAGSVILSEPLDFGEADYLALGEDMNFTGGEATLKHFFEQTHPEKVKKDRNTEEVEAESVSFAVCCYYGIETGENSFGYIASWSGGMELKELRASLETINRTADGLITDIDRNFTEICKERGIDLSNEQVGASVLPGDSVGGGETRDLRYEPLPAQGVDKKFYELAYTAPLPDGATLDTLWDTFNTAHPADYLRPSMSVSDIIAIRKDGVVSCHYVDRLAFTELHGFLQPENYLKSAEMAMEDDYNMVDGIINNGPKQPTVAELEEQAKSGQPISLMDLAGAIQREKEEKQQKPAPGKKPSILAKIRKPLPAREDKKTAPERSAEKEYTR